MNRIASSLRFSPIFSEHRVFSWRCGLCYGTRLALSRGSGPKKLHAGCDDLRALTLAAAILHDQLVSCRPSEVLENLKDRRRRLFNQASSSTEKSDENAPAQTDSLVPLLPSDDIKLRELLEGFGLIERFTPLCSRRSRSVALRRANCGRLTTLRLLARSGDSVGMAPTDPGPF